MAGVQKVIFRLHELAIPVPFGLIASSDSQNPTQVLADVLASGLGLPDRDYYVKSEPRFQEAREKYRVHVAHVIELGGASRAASRQAADAVFAMEKELAVASLDNVALRDPKATDHKMHLHRADEPRPGLRLAGLLRRREAPARRRQRAAARVHEGHGPAPPRDAARLVEGVPRVAPRSAPRPPTSPSAFVKESFAFEEQYLGGAKEMKPRWKRCAESTDSLLGEALGRKYVEKHFPPAARARMQELVKNLLLAMGDTIRGLDWMSPATKAKALEKLATFNPKIGYPDKWKDYSKVTIGRDTLWANVAAGRKWNVDDDRAQIGKPVDRGRWGMTPPTSNAYYNPLLNEIVFPAGILQPPAFSVDATDAMNYGAIGVVIGHEISHGFDDQGAQYDAQGRLRNWWTPGRPREVPRAGAVRGGPVRGLRDRARHPPQREAGPRRVDRRPRRREDRLPGLPEVARGQAPGADDRRLHAGAAVLRRLGPVPRRRDPSGDAAADGPG